MKTKYRAVSVLWLAAVWIGTALPAFGITDTCPPFYLRTETGAVINPITGENADQPYSTRRTCGACHDVDTISKGWHFMMDWDKASDDRFKNTRTPWLVSTGLTGGMTPYGYYFLAKKKNTHPDEIDLSVFDFIARAPAMSKGFQKPGCAGCHPGGGMLETDRDGMRYDTRLAETPALARTFDGDYYKSRWDKTGVIEPDCFICHSSRYMIRTRIVQMTRLNFKWAGVAASGIGQVHGRVSAGEVPKVVYNRRLFNEDGRFILPDMVFKPRAGNCLICHESIELGKRGNSWDDPVNPDVHHLAGLTCIDCHPGDLRHNFAKGNAMANHVADDLDNTMRSCRDCHTRGYKGATRMIHRKVRKDHLDKLSCEACHIPELNRSAVGAMYVNTGRFGKIGRPGTRRFGEHKPWKPAYVVRRKDKDRVARITPVNPFFACLFTNRQADGIYTPLFLSEIKTAYDQCRDRLSQRQSPYDFHDPGDIVLMLKTLARTLEGNRRLKGIAPCFHDGDLIHFLDGNQVLISRKDNTWVNRIPGFSISHNVAPVEKALGSGGCKDCHAKGAHLFEGRVITRFFGEDGRPETVSMARFMNLKGAVANWNRLFGVYLSYALPVFLGLGFLVILAGAYLLRGRSQVPAASLLVPVMLAALFSGHLLLAKETGIIPAVAQAVWQKAGPAAVFFIAAALGCYFYFMARQRRSGAVYTNLLAAVLTGATGLVLWLDPLSIKGWKLPLLLVHTGSATIFLAALVCLMIKHISRAGESSPPE